MSTTGNLLLILITILLPPVSVFLMTGFSCDVLINLCLTALGYVPGHIHAFWLIYKKAKAEEVHGPGNVTYHGNGEFHGAHGYAHAGQAPVGSQGYGTIPQA